MSPTELFITVIVTSFVVFAFYMLGKMYIKWAGDHIQSQLKRFRTEKKQYAMLVTYTSPKGEQVSILDRGGDGARTLWEHTPNTKVKILASVNDITT